MRSFRAAVGQTFAAAEARDFEAKAMRCNWIRSALDSAGVATALEPKFERLETVAVEGEEEGQPTMSVRAVVVRAPARNSA